MSSRAPRLDDNPEVAAARARLAPIDRSREPLWPALAVLLVVGYALLKIDALLPSTSWIRVVFVDVLAAVGWTAAGVDLAFRIFFVGYVVWTLSRIVWRRRRGSPAPPRAAASPPPV
jgi:hypothetical protein